MDVVQQDIAGFYNQVSHDRIITSVEYTVLRFIDLQQCPPDQALNISPQVRTHTTIVSRTLESSQ